MFPAAIEWSRGIEDAWSKLATFVPKLLGLVVVLVIGMLVAKAIRKAARRVLEAVKLDTMVGRSGLGRSLRNAGLGSPTDLIVKVLYAGLVLIVLQLAIGVMGPNPVSDALRSMMAFVPKLAVALIILFVTGMVADRVGPVVRDLTSRQSYGAAVTKAAIVAIWLIGGFAALDQVQVARDIVDTLFRTLVASLGAILVIKFGVGGIWAARDRMWPRVYDALGMPKPADAERKPV